MENKEFAVVFEKRTRTFAVRIIRLSITLPKNEEGRVIKNQITKSGTSIGANYREANRARSKSDFKNKLATNIITYVNKTLPFINLIIIFI